MSAERPAARRNHKPHRTCMACRQADTKDALVRVAAGAQEVSLDWSGKLGGRGGYLHPRRQCLELFVRSRVSRFNSLGRGLNREERLDLVNKLTAHLAPNQGVE